MRFREGTPAHHAGGPIQTVSNVQRMHPMQLLRKSIATKPAALLAIALALIGGPVEMVLADVKDTARLRARFDHLSQNGNSNCSRQFIESVSKMPTVARLQGSCCSPMDFHRYGEQTEGLKAATFASIGEIPPDPYDISAPLAARLMKFYDVTLTPAEQAAYDYAMQNSNERGPCCCQCWRWVVYGGLAKHLIRDRGFSGEQIAKLWDLSDGCGGTAHAH